MLKLYERLSALVEKLPGGLQKPILRELVPIRELFLEQRPARLLIVGGAQAQTVPALLHLISRSDVQTGGTDRGWRSYGVPDRGEIEIFDARGDVPNDLVTSALSARAPDVVIFLRAEADVAENFDAAFAHAADRVALADGPNNVRLPMVALSFGDADDAGRVRLSALLHSRREFGQRQLSVFASKPENGEAIAEAICQGLPNAAKLEFARLTQARSAQAEIAGSLLKSFTAVCGVIGVQPIPLADLPVLTTLQTLLVGSIVYVSGRPANARLIAEFAGALGVNIGVGFAFREGARALLKVFPVWGNAISGIVAGAGTYAIGRAAIAYFIEELPMQETKKLFQRLQPGLESFRTRALPGFRRPRTGSQSD